MKLTCDKTALADALSLCIHAIPSKSPIPTLEGVLFNINKERMTLCGYNMQMCIQKSIEVQADDFESYVLPARVLFDIVRRLKGDTVTIEFDGDLNATVSCGRSVFHLKAESGYDYPEMPAVAKSRYFEVSSCMLREMLNDTMFAISTNENKPVHMGTLFETDKNILSLISVDGYRLAVRKEEIAEHDGPGFSFVVPGATLKELTRMLPDSDDIVRIYPEIKHGLFEFCGTMLTTRLLDGDFLNYRTAMSEDMPFRMTINKSELIEAVERVSLIISERLKNPVRCLFEGESLKLSCMTALGQAFDEIEIPFFPEKMEIGFNNRYLLDALKACPDETVVLELKSSLSPCLLKPVEGDKFIYLVLPVRLKAGDL